MLYNLKIIFVVISLKLILWEVGYKPTTGWCQKKFRVFAYRPPPPPWEQVFRSCETSGQNTATFPNILQNSTCAFFQDFGLLMSKMMTCKPLTTIMCRFWGVNSLLINQKLINPLLLFHSWRRWRARTAWSLRCSESVISWPPASASVRHPRPTGPEAPPRPPALLRPARGWAPARPLVQSLQ